MAGRSAALVFLNLSVPFWSPRALVREGADDDDDDANNDGEKFLGGSEIMITHTSSGRWWAMMPFIHWVPGYHQVIGGYLVSTPCQNWRQRFPGATLSWYPLHTMALLISDSISVCIGILKFMGLHDCLHKSRLKNQDSLLSAAPDVGEFGAVRSDTSTSDTLSPGLHEHPWHQN